jgi:hypothetical protein
VLNWGRQKCRCWCPAAGVEGRCREGNEGSYGDMRGEVDSLPAPVRYLDLPPIRPRHVSIRARRCVDSCAPVCRFVRASVDWCAFFPFRPFVASGRLQTEGPSFRQSGL